MYNLTANMPSSQTEWSTAIPIDWAWFSVCTNTI